MVMDLTREAHVKLLARELLSLTADPLTGSLSTSAGRHVSKAEAVGVVVSRERRNDFLRFHVDDGTGCIPCMLWLNHRHMLKSNSPLNSTVETHMAKTQLGVVVCVRGQVSSFRGAIELVVDSLVVERDPHAEVLHWLQCLRLAKCCYRPDPTVNINVKKRKNFAEDN